jgi:hypothetical protein
VLVVKKSIDLEFEKLIKNRVPELVGDLMETTNRKFNSEFKRVAEKELNLKLHIEKVQKDLQLTVLDIKSIKSKYNSNHHDI